MRQLMTSIALLVVIGGPAAFAQSGGGSPRTTPSATGQPPQAPVGHRQPRADQVPSEKNLSDPNDPISREDALLDRKIKSICRGC